MLRTALIVWTSSLLLTGAILLGWGIGSNVDVTHVPGGILAKTSMHNGGSDRGPMVGITSLGAQPEASPNATEPIGPLPSSQRSGLLLNTGGGFSHFTVSGFGISWRNDTKLRAVLIQSPKGRGLLAMARGV